MAIINQQKFARGGMAKPGMALVGEEGPELVRFGAPGQVFTASQTKSILNNDNRAVNISINLAGNSSATSASYELDTMASTIKRLVRDKYLDLKELIA